MKAVIQRVSGACVSVDGEVRGSCGNGLCILLGVAAGDSERDAEALCAKILKLRIFEDDSGKMNRSLLDVGGELLVISNFTLLAAYKKGNRPDYTGAAAPDRARELYECFCRLCASSVHTECGVFGAHMCVDIHADGPVTIDMDSRVLSGEINI